MLRQVHCQCLIVGKADLDLLHTSKGNFAFEKK